MLLALQDMLPTIMSQMGMSTEGAFTSRADQQTGNGQSGATNEQTGDDEVPGMYSSCGKNIMCLFRSFSSSRSCRKFR